MIYRVSNVERYRQFELDDEADVASLIDDIAGVSEPSDAMLVGTAFHSALELAPHGEFESLEGDGLTFHFPGDLALELPAIREVRASKTWIVDGLPITISGQVDAIEGRRIDDHKTTSRFDPDRYLDGYQWRLYLSIFAADRFRWNVFEIAAQDEPGHYDVRAFHPLEQCRYPDLEADCLALVERFARFVRDYDASIKLARERADMAATLGNRAAAWVAGAPA